MFGKGRRSLLNPLQITGVIPLESWVWPPLSCCGGVRTQDRNKRINDLVMGIALLTWPKFAWIDWSTTCWIAFPALNVMGIWSHKLLSINFHVKWERVFLVTSFLLPFSYHPYIFLNPGSISHARKTLTLTGRRQWWSTDNSPSSLRIDRGAEWAPEDGTGSKGNVGQYRCRPGEVSYVREERSETYKNPSIRCVFFTKSFVILVIFNLQTSGQGESGKSYRSNHIL